jgi:hypothetical protein
MAMASAAAPPRIELNLEGMTSAYKLTDPIARQHDLKYTNNNGDAVQSRQDWTEKCRATTAAGENNALFGESRDAIALQAGGSAACKFPEARGYDHQDESVDVKTRVFLVDKEGVAVNEDVKDETHVDFTYRATYLFKYDATDSAGNHAEQVVFALILDDTEAPTFIDSCPRALTVEAASDWSLCSLQARDNVYNDMNNDGTYDTHNVTARIEYKIDFLDVGSQVIEKLGHGPTRYYQDAKEFFHPHEGVQGQMYTCTDGPYEDVAAPSPYNCGPTKLGKWLITASVNDDAGIYGHNANNNIATTHVAVVVSDSRPPVIQLAGHSPVYHECIKDSMFATRKTAYGYHDAGADALDMLDTWARKQTTKDYQAGCIDCNAAIDGLSGVAKCNGATYCKDCGDDCASSWVWNYNNVHDEHDNARGTIRSGANGAATGTTLYEHTFLNRLEQNAFTWDSATHSWNTDQHQKKTRTIQFDAEDDRCLGSDSTMTAAEAQAHKATCESNNAVKATRSVITQDTIKPTLTLKETASASVTTYENSGKIAHHNVLNANEGIQHTDGDSSADSLGIDPLDSVEVEDLCDDGLTITRSWGPREYNSRQLGHYVRTYTVTDKRYNVASITRTFNVIDMEAPSIEVVGAETRTYNATRDSEYTDSGATCNDYVDGELSHAVEVSGEVVNMRIPGTYTIRYDCTDLSGNAALPAHRTVEIEDITCPQITLRQQNLMYVEAGFPYVDAGATATDTLDGDITQYIWTNGNTVNHQQAFYNQPNCEEIQQQCQKDRGVHKVPDQHDGVNTCRNNGEYYITTIRDEKTFNGVSSRRRYHRQLVHCWMDAPVKPVTFKVFQLNDCFEVWQELYGGFPEKMECHKQDMCPMIGMKKENAPSAGLIAYIQATQMLPAGSPLEVHDDQRLWGATANAANPITNSAGQGSPVATNGNWYGDTTYICVDDETTRADVRGQWVDSYKNRDATLGDQSDSYRYQGSRDTGDGPKITNAEGGKYVIQFHVSDKAGNTECATLHRTVVVKDTLPPIITLALKETNAMGNVNRLIHYGSDSAVGINGEKNPAGANINGHYNDGVTANPYLKTASGESLLNANGGIIPGKVAFTANTADGPTGSAAYTPQIYMAEAVGSNAWIIGAVASAVAGVALLSYSSSKTTVSVPV